MRTIEETLNDAKSLVDKIYENMSTVQTCEAIRDQIKTMKICYTGGDENRILVLDKVMDEDQMKLTCDFINKMIDNRRDEATKYLDFLNGKISAIPNPVFEEAIKGMESKEVIIPDKIKNAEPSKKPASRMNMDEIKNMLAKGKSVRQIADYYGYKAAQSVYLFMDANGITSKQPPKEEPKKVEKRVLTEIDIPRIKEQYTAGKMCLADMAMELGVGNGELYAFAEKHGLIRKPVKPSDPFRDKNQMGKDEFKTKMMSGRK